MYSLKEIRQLEKSKKARDTQGLFVTEGRKLFQEAPAGQIRQIVTAAGFEKSHPEIAAILDGMRNIPMQRNLADSRFASVSDTQTPQGILTVMEKSGSEKLPAEEILGEIMGRNRAPFFLLLENLQDPGNVGTILRTAEAAGVDAVFLTEGCADLYAPKTIRSTMGSLFRVPHYYVKEQDLPPLFSHFSEAGGRSYAAHLKGDRSYTECDYSMGTMFVIGNEGNGITDRTAEATDQLIKIPMMGQVESLNAAMAAGILMYEAARQRRI
ncbi:MAG: RNA methyltransferase [Lachnospiraceae bacterium]|nr:RNA methyltransferase [Lachnospiraceae bacterium]